MRVGGETGSGDVAAGGRRNKRTGKRHEGEPGVGGRSSALPHSLHRQPPEILVRARFMPMVYRGDVAREGFAESPGSGGASPYLRRASRRVCRSAESSPGIYSPASRRVAANQFCPIPISPLCDLRGLCAMLSPKTCVSRPPSS